MNSKTDGTCDNSVMVRRERSSDGVSFAHVEGPTISANGLYKTRFRLKNTSEELSWVFVNYSIYGERTFVGNLSASPSPGFEMSPGAVIEKDVVLLSERGDRIREVTWSVSRVFEVEVPELELNRLGGTFEEDGWLIEAPPRQSPKTAASTLRRLDLRLMRKIEAWEKEDRSHLSGSSSGMWAADLARLAGVEDDYPLRALPDIRRYVHCTTVKDRTLGVLDFNVQGLSPAGVKALRDWGIRVQDWR